MTIARSSPSSYGPTCEATLFQARTKTRLWTPNRPLLIVIGKRRSNVSPFADGLLLSVAEHLRVRLSEPVSDIAIKDFVCVQASSVSVMALVLDQRPPLYTLRVLKSADLGGSVTVTRLGTSITFMREYIAGKRYLLCSIASSHCFQFEPAHGQNYCRLY